MSKGYCCFTVASTRQKICSAKKFDDHGKASEWVSATLKSLNLAGNDIAGKPRYPLDNQENNAVIH